MKTSLVTCLVLAACGGGSNLDPGAGSDPGTGTSTLTIEGGASASPRLSNAVNPGDFDTDFDVRVRLNAQGVTSGTVTFTGASGVINLIYDPNNNGRWRGRAAGYDEVYILDVVSGNDNVHGVRVDGPDIHVFNAPTSGATVNSTLAIQVDWSRDDMAESISINTQNLDNVAIADTGHYLMAPGALEAKRDVAKDNDIQLRRTNRVTPAGAAGGSSMSVSVENQITVVALPNPAL